jgi:hypothetical protein
VCFSFFEKKVANNSQRQTSSTRTIQKVSVTIKGETFTVPEYYKPTKILGHGAYAVVW